MSERQGLAQRWNRYWFRPAPVLDLAILRLVAVGCQLALMLSSLGNIEIVSQVPHSFYKPLAIFKLMMAPFGGGPPSLATMQTIQAVTLVAGGLALIGLRTNLALILFAIGCTFIQAWSFSFGDVHHPPAIMMIALAALALSPAGRALSVDAYLERRRNRLPRADQMQASSDLAGWPILLVQWFFALMYLSAFYAKLTNGHLQWANGYTLQYYLAVDGLRWGSDLGVWLSQFHWLILLGQWGVMVFQGTFFLSLLIPRLKWLYVPAGMAMHVGIYVTLTAPFFQWAALYVVFIPWSRFFALMGWLSSSTERTAAPPRPSLA